MCAALSAIHNTGHFHVRPRPVCLPPSCARSANNGHAAPASNFRRPDGDYGKPRPAVIVQSDAFPENHVSVVVCQLTSELVDAPDFRLTIEPSPGNGLRPKSQVMADKPVTVRRERIGQRIGRLGDQDMARVGIGLAFVLGLAD